MLSVLAFYTLTATSAERPNILLILADDLGYADVGFNNGAPDIKTPNIDKLAANGLQFAQAYTAHPFCGPSRAALMTGLYPHKIGSQFNLPAAGSDFGISLKEPFISKVLQDSGYFTGAIGKWHLGEAPEFHPNKRGFDEFFGFLGGGHVYFPEKYLPKYDSMIKRNAKNIWNYLLPMERNGVEERQTEYVTDFLSTEAISFIDKAKGKSQPFFLYLAYNAPHTPLEAKEDDLALFSDIKDIKRRTYVAMVYAMDRGIGRITARLKANNQLDNTLIVFLSDNGGKTSQGGRNFPLKEGKGSVQEGGYRTPMLFHWPAKIKSGTQYPHPVLAIDFYPTFVQLAQAKLPNGKELHGKKMWPHIINGTEVHKNEAFYVLRHREKGSDVASRKGQWKAISNGNKGWRLYNIYDDMAENNDLSSKHPNILKDMVEEMHQWTKSNSKPNWFHAPSAEKTWKENKMPRFEETFGL